MKEKKFGFMYRRISSRNQIGNNSFDAQKEAIQEFAAENNIKIVGDYMDTAKTGTVIRNRAGFQKMLDDLKKHPEVKYIIIHFLDRSNRNAGDFLNVIYDLELTGVHVLTTTGLDSMNPEDRPRILDEAVAAEKYSLRLSQETMKGLTVNAKEMLHNGGVPPYGYTVGPDRKLHIDPSKYQAVEKIFNMYATDMSYEKIIEWLDENGYKTARGESFRKTSIKSILENEKYCGNYFWNKRAGKDFRGMRNSHKLKDDYFHVEGGVPAIVSKELFNKVQNRLSDNKNKIRSHNGKNFYPMNGRIYCSKCGKPLQGKVQYSKTNKNNEPVKQYKFSCDCPEVKTVNEKYLDDMIIYGLRECIFSPANLEELLTMLNEYSESENQGIDLQIAILQGKKSDLKKRHDNLMDVVEEGNGNKSIIAQIDKLQGEIEAIEEKIRVYEASKKVFTMEDLASIRLMFTDYVRETHNEDVINFIDDTIEKIEVGDYIEVKLKKNIKIDSNTKKIFNN